MIVVGVDGWKGRWVAVYIQKCKFHSARVFDSVEEITEQSEPTIIGFDVPIGLVDIPPRLADVETRKLLGKRRSSVFDPAAAFCLNPKWTDYRQANAESKRRTGRGISAQGFALMKNIRDVDQLAKSDSRIHEIHPELSFMTMNGDPLPFDKKSWNGMQLRVKLLKQSGINLPKTLPAELAKVPADDLLDAAAVAWSANRIALGNAKAVPDSHQRLERIWY